MANEKRDRFLSNQRSATPGVGMPIRPSGFTAQSSDLGVSRTNPTGIWSPAYIRLKQALDNGADADTVLDALYKWLDNKTQRGITPAQVDHILDLPSPEHSYKALLELIGGKLNPEILPPLVQQTLHRAIQRIAQQHVERGEQELAKSADRLKGIRGRYGVESAKQIVRSLLAS